MDVVIRDYRSDDWSAICRVHDRSRPDELRGSYDARAFIPLAEDPEGEYINACVMFVAQHDGDVVGFAGIDDPHLAWLYVDPANYRRGIGRALLRHCLARGLAAAKRERRARVLADAFARGCRPR